MNQTSRGPRIASNGHLPPYLWHEELHRKLCSERLVYVRIGFTPAYDRDLAVEQIKLAFTNLGILSFTLWEMFGDADILLRAWLPPSVESLDLLRKRLDEAIVGPHRPLINFFQVDSILHHHLWQSKADLLAARRDIKREHYSTGNSEARIPRAEAARYREAGHLAPTPRSTFLKFFTLITNADQQTPAPAAYEIANFESSLKTLMTSVKHPKSLALYEGNGMGNYLISGRVRPADFEALSDELNDKINGLGRRYARIKTITWLSAFSLPLLSHEELTFPGSSDVELARVDPPVLSDLLASGEGQRVEVKGSAFKDLKPAVSRGEPAVEQPHVLKNLAKAIVGLLNTEGGHVIVGVLEADEFRIADVRKVLTNSVKLEEFIVVGVEHEYPVHKRWDGYINKLRQKLATEITPRPDSWLEYIPVEHNGLRCCVISVHQPDEWFWAKDDLFYVRHGNGTDRLTGMDQYRHMRSHPR